VFGSTQAFGQAPMVINNPPLEEQPLSPPPPPPQDRPFVDRCFSRPVGYYGTPYWGVPHPVVVVSGPIGNGSSGSTVHGAQAVGSGGSSSSSGGGDGAVVLVVLAVVVAAALPFIFYALDDDAPPDVEGRFHCPSFELDLRGGVEGDSVSGPSVPFSARLRAGTSWLQVMTQFDVAPWSEQRSLLNATVAAVVRFTPRKHVELGISAGYRSLILRDEWRPGFEAAIPHEYVFFRDGASQVGLEVRPAVFVWRGGVDLSLDAALRIPLGPYVTASLGGRVFSVDALHTAGAGASAGLGFKL
jgi:hypothetical protein